MAIEKIRLADGTEINVEEWLMWPLFSTGLGQSDGTNGVGGELRLFEYIVGDNIPQLGVPVGTPLQAGPSETNQVVRGKINHDEGFICFNMTYAAFSLESDPAYPDPQAGPNVSAPEPILAGTNLRRMQRDCMLELFVGAGITKPQVSAPLEYYGQGLGAVAFGSGDGLTVTGPGATNVALDYGTGGPITPHNQRRWHLPVKIDADRDIYASLRTPEGAIRGLTQDWRLRVTLDGLKRRPVA
jgi:hypothetical protein